MDYATVPNPPGDLLRPPPIDEINTYGDVTLAVGRQIAGKPSRLWIAAFVFSLAMLGLGGYALGWSLWEGIGMWGENKTIGWAWDITNFVWWIGIGHAGTLISAILLLFRQKWRNAINRSAEAMTLIAVLCAAVFVAFHTGRPWLVYWIFPLPNNFGSLWVNFHSPLVWDAFAVSTYLIVSLVYWYVGLIPDLALLSRRLRSPALRKIYRFFSLGWIGSTREWIRYEETTLVLAGLAAPLVVSVHSIVGMDFCAALIPGWHSTIFPPYFVAGAVLSGFAMVLTLMIITRRVYHLEEYITVTHLESMNKIIIFMGGLVAIAYLTEDFMAWYSGNEYEWYTLVNRATGPYQYSFWSIQVCNALATQLFWFRKIRTSIAASFILSIVINIGMWLERFVIIVTSLHRDFLPSSWAMFYPTFYDAGVFVFSLGLFFSLFLPFTRYLPVINISEVKTLVLPSNKKLRQTQETSASVLTEPVHSYSPRQPD